ncbi:MAG: hypothetical protein CM1200mP24_00450 [Gammaproteobacteria bacterium]|nr:MAG: hypothetical protein CM1200mP24_00450 [Gammaproteobacteria bacterium]
MNTQRGKRYGTTESSRFSLNQFTTQYFNLPLIILTYVEQVSANNRKADMSTEIIETGTNELLCELADGVATVTLNRPEKRNALGDNLTPALRAILLTLEENLRCGAIVITGVVERSVQAEMFQEWEAGVENRDQTIKTHSGKTECEP